ncbi:MAG: hypothetical protein K0R18_591 [Bacillales bacterium]|jgi:hypothetical protein|nr:hypothetical protein [Bacillales bacterium]
METKKFYQRKWFTVLLLFFFTPVGIFLIFKYDHFSKTTKGILSVAFGIFFLTAAIIGITDDSAADRTDPDEKTVEVTAQKSEVNNKEEKAEDEVKKKAEDEAAAKKKAEKEAKKKADDEAAKKKAEEEATANNSVSTNQISNGIGLADTLEAYENEYGKNNGDGMMARFQNDYLLPIFADGRAMNLKIQFEATNDPSRTLKEAKQIAQFFIPKDAQFVKEYSDDFPRVVQEYQSESIAELYPSIEPVGTFIVIISHKDGNPNDVFGITVGVGNNP